MPLILTIYLYVLEVTAKYMALLYPAPIALILFCVIAMSIYTLRLDDFKHSGFLSVLRTVCRIE